MEFNGVIPVISGKETAVMNGNIILKKDTELCLMRFGLQRRAVAYETVKECLCHRRG